MAYDSGSRARSPFGLSAGMETRYNAAMQEQPTSDTSTVNASEPPSSFIGVYVESPRPP